MLATLSLLTAFFAQSALPTNGTEPCWSADGSKLAFGVSVGNARALWIMDADGTNAKEVVSAAENQHYPRWMPGEQRLAYVAAVGNGYEFFSVKLDGTDKRPVLPANAMKPGLVPLVWSPDGKFTAYSTKNENANPGHIVVTDMRTGEPVFVHSGPDRTLSAVFSPDGKRLLYLQKEQIWVSDWDGKNPKSIVHPEEKWFPIDPSWSPDGSRILYAITNAKQSFLASANSDGSGEKVLLKSPTRFFYPTWSPKGKIVIARKQTDKWDLYLYTISPDGDHERKLIGDEPAGKIFEVVGDYKISIVNNSKPGLEGSATWTRPLDGNVVRETWSVRTGGRPDGGEFSITRTGPTTFEAVAFSSNSAEQFVMSGTWNPEKKQLVFDRLLATKDKLFVRWVYEFAADGSFTKKKLTGDPNGKLTVESEYHYTKLES